MDLLISELISAAVRGTQCGHSVWLGRPASAL